MFARQDAIWDRHLPVAWTEREEGRMDAAEVQTTSRNGKWNRVLGKGGWRMRYTSALGTAWGYLFRPILAGLP
jgi:hypothetical protein